MEHLNNPKIEMNLSSSEQERCAICNRWTYKYARSNGRSFHLCDQHHTKEHFIHIINSRR